MFFKQLKAQAKPEYLYRPSQLVRRLLRRDHASQRATLPWGWPIMVNPNEDIGKALQTLGVYDLVVSEAILRLVDPSDKVLDIGANIGYMTAVMMQAASAGQVESFEPHPGLFAQLSANVALWTAAGATAQVKLVPLAVSDLAGSGTLVLPQHFAANNGVGYVGPASLAHDQKNLAIKLVRLDDHIENNQPIGLIKIDVEGHELKALHGAAQLLAQRRVRDILFEDHGKPETAVMALLRQHGFQLFRLCRSFWGPHLTQAEDDRRQSYWEPANFLATLDPMRVQQRFRARGWRTLQRRLKSF